MCDENAPLAEPLFGPDRILDVRPVPCSVKHGFIGKIWRQLPVGDSFVLLNNHDPVMLHEQFHAAFPRAFRWDYLERGPSDFRVRITKLKPLPENPSPDLGECPGH